MAKWEIGTLFDGERLIWDDDGDLDPDDEDWDLDEDSGEDPFEGKVKYGLPR